MKDTNHSHCIPYNKALNEKARANRRNPTPAEKKRWFEVLGNKEFHDLKFACQKPLDNLIVDFTCSKLRLVVEIDGQSHAQQQEYEEHRTERPGESGITLVRHAHSDVMNNLNGVYQDLSEKMEVLRKQQNSAGNADEAPPTRPLPEFV